MAREVSRGSGLAGDPSRPPSRNSSTREGGGPAAGPRGGLPLAGRRKRPSQSPAPEVPRGA
eukprot:15453819-Alexandrium_andersonii.AAC.1